MSLVIVGHGPSLKGLGRGDEIDAHRVVRLKNPVWEVRADHGKRVDVLCASTETMLALLDYPKVPGEYWAQPKKGSYSQEQAARFRQRAKAPLHIPLEVFLYWNAAYLARGMKHTNFSLGSAAIIFALELSGEKEILLAGFDNLLDPARPYEKIDRGRWRSDHDWIVENAMLAELAMHYGATIGAL